jgi:hypothetical protein
MAVHFGKQALMVIITSLAPGINRVAPMPNGLLVSSRIRLIEARVCGQLKKT